MGLHLSVSLTAKDFGCSHILFFYFCALSKVYVAVFDLSQGLPRQLPQDTEALVTAGPARGPF